MTNVTTKPQRMIGRKLHIDAAKKNANQILFKLKPHCELIATTGAVRRNESYLRTIDLICVPKLDKTANLFGEVEHTERSREFMRRAGSIGRMVSGTRSGSFMKFRLEAMDILVELYITTKEDFYFKLAMTTGPSLYTNITIKDAIRAKGYVMTDRGYRHIKETFFQNGKYWSIDSAKSGLPTFNSELEVFQWLGLEFIAPQLRGKSQRK